MVRLFDEVCLIDTLPAATVPPVGSDCAVAICKAPDSSSAAGVSAVVAISARNRGRTGEEKRFMSASELHRAGECEAVAGALAVVAVLMAPLQRQQRLVENAAERRRIRGARG